MAGARPGYRIWFRDPRILELSRPWSHKWSWANHRPHSLGFLLNWIFLGGVVIFSLFPLFLLFLIMKTSRVWKIERLIY